MIKIKGKVLSFDKKHSDGNTFPSNIDISIPQKVPIIWNFNTTTPSNILGHVSVVKKEDGLYFEGELHNNSDLFIKLNESEHLGVGGFYNRVEIDDNNVIKANLQYISITPTPVFPDYTFELVESEE